MTESELLSIISLPVRNHVAARVAFVDVDDVTNAALFQIVRAWAQFEGRNDADVLTWSHAVADSIIKMHHRTLRRKGGHISDTYAFTPDADDGTDEVVQLPEPRAFGEGEAPDEEPPASHYHPAPSVAWLPRAAYVFGESEDDALGVEAVGSADDEPEARAIHAQTLVTLAPLSDLLDPDEVGISQATADMRRYYRRRAASLLLNTPNTNTSEYTRHGMKLDAAWHFGPTPAELFRTLETLVTVDRRVPHALVKAYARDPAEVAKAFGFSRNVEALRRVVLQAISIIKATA